MKTIYLLGCSASKTATPQPAIKLYTGALFRCALGYAFHQADFEAGDALFVLSAKHGLLPLETIVDPYDTGWSSHDAITRAGLRRQIGRYPWKRARFVLLSPLPYATRFLDAYRDLTGEHAEFVAPLRGLGIGAQARWLTHHTYDDACACRSETKPDERQEDA